MVLSSCNCLKNCPYNEIDTRDSIIYHDVLILRDSTIYYTVEDSVIISITKDTTSHLETDMAISDVVVSNGELYHRLRNKDGLRPINITIPTRVTTSERVKTITRNVEIPSELSWWQTTRIHLGEAFLIVMALVGIYILIRVLHK